MNIFLEFKNRVKYNMENYQYNQEDYMFKLLVSIIVVTLSISTAVAEKAPQKVVDLANKEIVKYGTDAIIIKAIVAENSKKKTLEQIKKIDNKWKATPGIDAFMKTLMDSECGKHLVGIQKSKGYISEIFAMDNQGANVAMSDKTSDYWQGDEAKFKESFKGGAGAVHISDVEFDESSQTYSVQISVPVKDGSKVIGAITFGIDVDAVE